MVSRSRSSSLRRPFFGRGDLVEEKIQGVAVLGGVEALVEAGGAQVGEEYAGLLHQVHGDLVVGLAVHHPVVEEEAIPVFHEGGAHAEFHRHPGLALDDPFGVGDRLAAEDAGADLLALTPGMEDEIFDLLRQGGLQGRELGQQGLGLLDLHGGLVEQGEEGLTRSAWACGLASSWEVERLALVACR